MTDKKPKRSHGESHISEEPDARGYYHGYVSMGRKPDGTRDRRHVSNKKRAVVVRMVRDLERRRDEGRVPTAGKAPTVEKWLTHWLTNIAARKVRPKTLEGYWSRARAWIIPCLGSYRLDRLQPEHLESFYTHMADEGLSARSILLAHRVLSRALKVAVQRNVVARNVCTLVDAPSVQRREVEPLNQADAQAILKVARDRPNAARWSVALALGLRQGEALGLQWRYVDLEAGTLRVAWELQRLAWKHGCADPEKCGLERPMKSRASKCPKRRGGGLVLAEPKSATSRRTIKLPAPLVKELKAHRRWQRAERLATGPKWVGWEGRELVFCQSNGKPIDHRRDWG